MHTKLIAVIGVLVIAIAVVVGCGSPLQPETTPPDSDSSSESGSSEEKDTGSDSGTDTDGDPAPDPPTYSVSYQGNGNTGGTVPTDDTAYGDGDTVSVKANVNALVLTDHAFVEWNSAADGTGTAYAPGDTITIAASDIVLYAQWAPILSVMYDGNGQTSGAPPSDDAAYLSGDTVTVKDNTNALQKQGHTFSGWNTSQDGSGTSYATGASFTMPSEDMTLYAQWTQKPTYTVTYKGNGNSGGAVPTDNTNYLQGATVTVQGNVGTLTREGYRFDGWNTAADGNGTTYAANDTFTIGDTDVTLYAQWVAVYTVTYDGNGNTGGTVPSDGTRYVEGATVDVQATDDNLTRDGYRFDGWNTAADGSGTTYVTGDTFTIGDTDVTLYAQWVVVYSVTYDGNDSTAGAPPSDSHQYEDGVAVTVLAAPTELEKTGYSFGGWNTQADGSGTTYQPGETVTIQGNDIILYAHWLWEDYYLYYDMNGADFGEPIADSYYYYQDPVTVEWNDLYREGYEPNGWNTKADGSGTQYYKGDAFPMPAHEVTLYAQWTDIAPSSVSNVQATAGTDGDVTVTWTDAPEGDVTGARVTWTPTDGEAQPKVVTAGTESATVTGLHDGQEYTFTVTAVDDGGNHAVGASASAVAVDTTGPLPVSGLTSGKLMTGVQLQWEDPSALYLDHIEITWTPDGSTPVQVPVGQEQYDATGLTRTQTDAENLTRPMEYVFEVVAVDINGNRSVIRTATEAPKVPGTLRWKYDLPTDVDVHSSPLIDAAGTIYVSDSAPSYSSDGRLFALHGDGTEKWTYYFDFELIGSPMMAYGDIFAASKYYVHRLDHDGSRLWRSAPIQRIDYGPALGSNGVIYIGVYGETSPVEYSLYALDPADGQVEWKHAFPGHIESGMAVASDGTVYLAARAEVSGDAIYAINPDGTRLWSLPLGRYYDGFTNPAVDDAGNIYIGAHHNTDGVYELISISPGGTENWSAQVDHYIPGEPVIDSDGTIHVTTYDPSTFYAISNQGAVNYTVPLDSRPTQTPTIMDDGTIYVGLSSRLVALSPSGDEKWRFEGQYVGSRLANPAVTADGTVIVGGASKVYAIYDDTSGIYGGQWPKAGGNNRNTRHQW